MSLPAPDLDNRKFQDIVDDVKRQIGLRCPEWTDHNVSDPGITLLELFAYISESMLFQMNQVPEKNHIRFLELLGVKLEMPRPAVTDLRFMLTRSVVDRANAEFQGITIERNTVAATLRSESDDPIEFLTDFDLRLGRPELAYVVALSTAIADADAAQPHEDDVRRFRLDDPSLYQRPEDDESERPDPAFRIYGPRPAESDRLYLGFAADVSGHILDLDFDVAEKAGVGLSRGRPNQTWEVFDSADGLWRRVEPLDDASLGFATNGAVRLEMPHGLQPQVVAGHTAYWVRVRYTEQRESLPASDGYEIRPYDESPAIRGVTTATVGGHVPSTNCHRIAYEELGVGDNRPGQRFRTRYAPIFELGPGDRILTGPRHEDADDRTDWVEWTVRPDFSESGPNDRHFTVDERTGEISFGPLVARPDGREPDRHGAAPPKDHVVVITDYAFGGGTLGNVRENRIVVDKANKPFVASVTNPIAAQNGRDMETVEHAKMKATKILKTRNRAVTAEDFEILAAERPGVGRAFCLQPRVYRPDDHKSVPPGTVELLVVPALGDLAVPSLADLVVTPETLRDVQAHLDDRRLLTTVLDVREPRYVFVETEIKIVADPRLDADAVALAVRQRLARFLHPLTGGHNPEDPTSGRAGKGWPFGRRLTLTDLYVQIGQVPGVAYLLDTSIFAYRVGRPSTGRFGKPDIIDPVAGLDLDPDETICSREHTVRTIPIHAKDLSSRLGH